MLNMTMKTINKTNAVAINNATSQGFVGDEKDIV